MKVRRPEFRRRRKIRQRARKRRPTMRVLKMIFAEPFVANVVNDSELWDVFNLNPSITKDQYVGGRYIEIGR